MQPFKIAPHVQTRPKHILNLNEKRKLTGKKKKKVIFSESIMLGKHQEENDTHFHNS